MTWLTAEQWPLVAVCLAMIAAAVIDWWKFKVPNWLTFPIILSGWALGLAHTLGLEHAGTGGILASLGGTFVGFILLYPMYAFGGMGAGDVKMQMGFGAWVGAYYGAGGTYANPGFFWIVLLSFCVGAIIGGVIAVIMIALRGDFRNNLRNVRGIAGDFLAVMSGRPGQAVARAQERRPRWHRLPYGVPLCIGFVSYLLYLNGHFIQ